MTELRNKHNLQIKSLKKKWNTTIQHYKNKERLSRNSLYVRERAFKQLSKEFKNISDDNELYMKDLYTIIHQLIILITNNNFVLFHKETRNVYTYDIASFITYYYLHPSVLSEIFPDVYSQINDYIITIS